MRRVTAVSVALALAFAAGCGEDEPRGPVEPPGPPSADSLETVDLCGGDDTAGFFRDHLREGGSAAVTGWLRQNVSPPVNLHYCDRVSPPTDLTQVVRVTVYRIIVSGGSTSGVLYEAGPSLTDLPLGMRNETLDVFGEASPDRDAEGVRISLHYHGG